MEQLITRARIALDITSANVPYASDEEIEASVFEALTQTDPPETVFLAIRAAKVLGNPEGMWYQ